MRTAVSRRVASRASSCCARTETQRHNQQAVRPPIHGKVTSSSVEKSTWKISLVVIEPCASFFSWMSCCASANPAGITIVPPGFNW